MKLFAVIILLASATAQAKVKKETWTCEAQGKEVVTAVFHATSLKATYHAYEDEKVALSFHQAGQRSALNGSQKTVLTGSLDAGYDNYTYKVTLIRTVHSDFSYAGTYNAQAVIETVEVPSCTEPALTFEVLNCEVVVSE